MRTALHVTQSHHLPGARILAVALSLFLSSAFAKEDHDPISKQVVLIPSEVDFGKVRYSSDRRVLRRKIKIRNISTKLITISAIKPSCSCTKPKVNSLSIGPLGEQEIEIGLDLAGIYGSKITNVVFLFKDESFSILPVKIVVDSIVSFMPDTIRFTQTEGERLTHTVATISRFTDQQDEAAASLRAIEGRIQFSVSTNGFVVADEGDSDRSGVYLFKVFIDASTLKLGSYVGSLHLQFKDDIGVEIPYSIEIRKPVVFKEFPHLLKIDPDQKCIAKLSIEYNGKAKPRVIDLLIGNKRMSFTSLDKKGNQMDISFEISKNLLKTYNAWNSIEGILRVEESKGREQVLPFELFVFMPLRLH